MSTLSAREVLVSGEIEFCAYGKRDGENASFVDFTEDCLVLR